MLLNRFWSRIQNHFMAFGLFASFTIGGVGEDILSDTNHKRDFIYSKQGNDVIVYTPKLNRNHEDYYDGGPGIDTLWLRMSLKEYYSPLFQADLIMAHVFIRQHVDIHSDSDQGARFQFQSFNLQFRNMEHIIVERISDFDGDYQTPVPKKTYPILDSSQDSLA